jgi:large subunit ribosomal protein L32
MPHEPKKRHSRQRQGKRRAAIKLELPTPVVCKNCGAASLPHTVCVNCGYYKGEQVLKTKNGTKTSQASA